MSSKKMESSSPHGMLEAYLYDNGSIADRLHQCSGVRSLRKDQAHKDASINSHARKQEDNSSMSQVSRDDAALRRLEKEMSAMTDKLVLQDARQYQESMTAPSHHAHRSLLVQPGLAVASWLFTLSYHLWLARGMQKIMILVDDRDLVTNCWRKNRTMVEVEELEAVGSMCGLDSHFDAKNSGGQPYLFNGLDKSQPL